LFGYKFYGTPYIPFYDEWSFYRENQELEKFWKMIPNDTDILITHTPPEGILDIPNDPGCKFLREQVLNRVKPLYHIFGHIHEGFGTLKKDNITFINASNLNGNYIKRPDPPMTFTLPIKKN